MVPDDEREVCLAYHVRHGGCSLTAKALVCEARDGGSTPLTHPRREGVINMIEKIKNDTDLLTNSRTRMAFERITGEKLPPSLDELVDSGQITISEAIAQLNNTETRNWVLGWRYTPRNGFEPVFDEKGGH